MIKAILRLTHNSFFKKAALKRLTFKRLFWLIYFYIFFPIWQATIWSGLALDKIFYPGHTKVVIKEPIFILGNPRSGTTFLHRLLAKDTKNFNTMKVWEIFLAPSIFGRKVLKGLASSDRSAGGLFVGLLRKFDDFIQTHKLNKIHGTPLWEAEEDDNLLMHIWANLKVWIGAGMLDEAKPYVYFDQQMPKKEKKRIFKFYTRCLKRHIYFHRAQDKHYLAKNPNFSPQIESLYKYFPDCKIIYLVRNPLKVVPSYMTYINAGWETLGDVPQMKKCRDFVLEVAKHWYEYPLEKLRKAPRGSYIIVKLEDLAKDPKKTVGRIYKKLGFDMPKDFAEGLEKVSIEAKSYESPRKYAFSKMGLTKKRVMKKYQKIFKRFRFSMQG